MAKVNFYLKEAKAKTQTLIYLYFNYDGRRLKYSTGETILVKDWNVSSQRVKKTMGGSLELNHLFDKMEEEVKKIYRTAITHNEIVTNEYLKLKLDAVFNTGKNPSKSFLDFLNEFIEVQKSFKTHRTIQKYRTLYNHLSDFQARKKHRLSFEKMDSQFYDTFTAYYISDKKLLNNSIAKYIKTLKTFLNWAAERGYNIHTGFKKFKAKETSADIIYLTEKELFQIYKKDLAGKPKLERVRDVFCFGCFTGLRFSDIVKIKKENISPDAIRLVSEKTSERIIVPLNDYANEILLKYDHELPVMSNQKTNDYLKELGKLAEIDEPIMLTKFRGVEEIQMTKPKYEFLSTHAARRTFVTLSLEKGMRPEMVMSITGHKEYDTFKKYIKITNKVKMVEMSRIWNREPSLAVIK